QLTLIEHWDGATWSVVNSPNRTAIQNFLTGVACVSASDCWAVGAYRNGSMSQAVFETLIEHWDGTSWSIIQSPNANAAKDNRLFGVTCASTTDCWSVGQYRDSTDSSQPLQTLIEHWDGTSWSIVTSPNDVASLLSGVACTSASDCWAIG